MFFFYTNIWTLRAGFIDIRKMMTMAILYTILSDSHLDDSLVYSEYRFTIAFQFKSDVKK